MYVVPYLLCCYACCACRSKLAAGLLSGGHSCPAPGDKDAGVAEGQKGISPRMFKALIGRGHVEFSTNRQQVSAASSLHLPVLCLCCRTLKSSSSTSWKALNETNTRSDQLRLLDP